MEWLLYLIGVIIKFINIILAAHYSYKFTFKDDRLDIRFFKDGFWAIIFYIIATS